MLYDSLSQPYFLLILSLFGFLCGFIFDVENFFIVKIKNKNTILKNFLDFFSVLLSFLCLFFVNLNFHYGIPRLFTIIIFFLSEYIQRLLSKKLFAKLFMKCYNIFVRRKRERSEK